MKAKMEAASLEHVPPRCLHIKVEFGMIADCKHHFSLEDPDESNRAAFKMKVENFSSIKDSVSLLSDPPVIIRNFPWKIMIQKRLTDTKDFSVGYYLQCNGKSEATNWSCFAKASLM